jgi:hypothetical protein
MWHSLALAYFLSWYISACFEEEKGGRMEMWKRSIGRVQN